MTEQKRASFEGVEVLWSNGTRIYCVCEGEEFEIDMALVDEDSDTWDKGDYGRLILKKERNNENTQ